MAAIACWNLFFISVFLVVFGGLRRLAFLFVFTMVSRTLEAPVPEIGVVSGVAPLAAALLAAVGLGLAPLAAAGLAPLAAGFLAAGLGLADVRLRAGVGVDARLPLEAGVVLLLFI